MSSLCEGLTVAFLESMSAGKPIVANNVDGANRVLIDGETGLLLIPSQLLVKTQCIFRFLD
jgi:glycosyltransferase involved in cell wall biosynthesis